MNFESAKQFLLHSFFPFLKTAPEICMLINVALLNGPLMPSRTSRLVHGFSLLASSLTLCFLAATSHNFLKCRRFFVCVFTVVENHFQDFSFHMKASEARSSR